MGSRGRRRVCGCRGKWVSAVMPVTCCFPACRGAKFRRVSFLDLSPPLAPEAAEHREGKGRRGEEGETEGKNTNEDNKGICRLGRKVKKEEKDEREDIRKGRRREKGRLKARIQRKTTKDLNVKRKRKKEEKG